MKKVDLEVIKSFGHAGEYPDGTFVRTTNETTHEFSAVEGKIIYYTNDYDIFSSIDKNKETCNYAVEIAKINKDSVKLKNIGNCIHKTYIINQNEAQILTDKQLKNGFNVKIGQTVWFNTCTMDASLDYYIKIK